MQVVAKVGIYLAVTAAVALPIAGAAEAKCTRLAFSVNDYGKVGPTNDAKSGLDKYIAKWTAERGITGYTTGPKKVTCELYLDVIVFDEYTCKAEASVCWADAGTGTATPPVADGGSAVPPASATKPANAAAIPATVAAPAPAAAAAQPPPASPAPVVQTVTAPAAPAITAPAATTSSPVTTGSVTTESVAPAPSQGAVVPPLEPDPQ